MQQQVHLLESLLHMLNVFRRCLHQHFFLTQITAQHADFFRRTKSLHQQSIGMQFLRPLAVQHIGLAARNILDPPRINQIDLEAALFENLVERDPVNSGRFQGHGRDATLAQPVGQRVQVGGKRFELAHRNQVAPFRHGDQMAIGTNVDARRIHIDVPQMARQIDDGKLFGFGRLLLCLV